MVALEDLGTLVPWAVAFGVASLAIILAKAIAAPFNVSILGTRPFQFVADGIEAGIVNPLNDFRAKSDAEIAKAFNALVDDTATVLGVFLVLGLGIKAALTYLWKTALGPFVHAITDTIARDASHALSDVTALTKTVTDNLASAESYAVARAEKALSDATSAAYNFAQSALSQAESYADDAVAKLRTAEDSAIDNAVSIANAAKAAGLAAAASAESAAEAVAKSALAESEAAASTALAQVKAIAVGAEGDLSDFEAYIKSLGLPATIAGVASISTLLTLVLSETGLENSSCRGKVKQICGTDPSIWTSILLGAAAVGIAIDYKAIIEAALTLVTETESAISALADNAMADVDDIAKIVSDAALAIAA